MPHRIKGLLFSQGASGYEPLRRDRRARLDALLTGDGRCLPQHLKAQLCRELDRLELPLEQIKAVEAERDALLTQQTKASAPPPMLLGDSAALLALVSDLREKVAARMGPDVTLASCFEAGRDGFWLHRLLTDNGVINHVVEPPSILVTRGARRAKNDRLDAQGLLRVLAAAFAGDHEICRMVRTPSVAEEDDKRPHREREYLVQERVRIENRIAALLATQGVLKRPSLRTWAADLDALRTGDGRALPPYLKAELDRLRRRLLTSLEMIREVEAAREQAMEADDNPANQIVKALCKLRGLGDNFSAVLAREVFYRTFDNRRQIAGYLGLAPTPFQSGGMVGSVLGACLYRFPNSARWPPHAVKLVLLGFDRFAPPS